MAFLLAGSNIYGLWLGIVLMGLFTFAESPQLQALLSDIAPPAIRDASYSLYFTLAFGVGSLWVALYGFVIERLGAPTGVPVAFVLMAGAFVLAALGTLPIRADERAAANAAFEARPARCMMPAGGLFRVRNPVGAFCRAVRGPSRGEKTHARRAAARAERDRLPGVRSERTNSGVRSPAAGARVALVSMAVRRGRTISSVAARASGSCVESCGGTEQRRFEVR